MACSCFLPPADNWWRNVSTNCEGHSGRDDLPSSRTWTLAVFSRAGGVWFGPRLDDVCYNMAEGTQPGLWHPETGASRVGWWAALPNNETHIDRWVSLLLRVTNPLLSVTLLPIIYYSCSRCSKRKSYYLTWCVRAYIRAFMTRH